MIKKIWVRAKIVKISKQLYKYVQIKSKLKSKFRVISKNLKVRISPNEYQ